MGIISDLKKRMRQNMTPEQIKRQKLVKMLNYSIAFVLFLGIVLSGIAMRQELRPVTVEDLAGTEWEVETSETKKAENGDVIKMTFLDDMVVMVSKWGEGEIQKGCPWELSQERRDATRGYKGFVYLTGRDEARSFMAREGEEAALLGTVPKIKRFWWKDGVLSMQGFAYRRVVKEPEEERKISIEVDENGVYQETEAEE